MLGFLFFGLYYYYYYYYYSTTTPFLLLLLLLLLLLVLHPPTTTTTITITTTPSITTSAAKMGTAGVRAHFCSKCHKRPDPPDPAPEPPADQEMCEESAVSEVESVDESEPDPETLRGIWAEQGEAVDEEPPQQGPPSLSDGFEKTSQDWFAALTRIFVYIGKEDSVGYDNNIALLLSVPWQLRHYAEEIRVGTNDYLLGEVLEAITKVRGPPLNKCTPCPLKYDGNATLSNACSLLSIFLKKMVMSILESHGSERSETWNPIKYKYVCMMIAYCNVISQSLDSSFRILPQYWPASQGSQILKTIKIEFQCGDTRKYTKHTRQQLLSGELEGRKRRAFTTSGYEPSAS